MLIKSRQFISLKILGAGRTGACLAIFVFDFPGFVSLKMDLLLIYRNDEVAFLLGKGGHYAVGAVLGKLVGNQTLVDECIQKYVAAGDICKPVDFFSNGGDELFVGRAGYLCGALWLQQKLGYQPVPREVS